MRIAVLGAKGRLSHTVAKYFLAHGHMVIAVTRSGKCEGLDGDVEHRAADAMKTADLIHATQSADLIFNGLNPPYDQWAERAMPMAQNVMAAARSHEVPHLFIGNVYNYGSSIPLDADETTPFQPDTRKGVIRTEMEALFAKEARDNGVKTVILRAGDFYGTRAKGSWFDLAFIKKFDKGVFTWPGPMNAPHAFAYLPDLGEAFCALVEKIDQLPLFDMFQFEGHTLTGEQFKALIEKAAGRDLKNGSFPWWLFKLASPFNRMMREVNEMSYLWQVPHSLNGRKLKSVIGEVKITPPLQAIRQALIDQGKLAA